MSADTHLSLVRLDEEATQLRDLLVETDQHTDRAGYVPRDPALVPSGLFASVGEEGASIASFHGTDWAAIVEQLAIQEILSLAPHALSGGQAVQAAVAITAAAAPDVWLLDRCFEWLDAKSRAPIRAFFARQLEAGCKVTEVANRDDWLLGPRAQRCVAPSVHRRAAQPALGDPVLTVEGLCIEFPGISIGPIDLVVRRSERLALLGPNGAGKTSVARAILGLIRYRGQVRFPGHAGKRAAAVIAFQNPDHQLFRPTVRGEIEEAARRLRAFDVERANMVVKSLGLGCVLDKDPLALPFAKRRLVTIAAALVPSLPVAILDEPSAFLNEEQVASVLRAAHNAARRGTAVIAISHDEIFVDAFASRAVHLERGQLVTQPVSG